MTQKNDGEQEVSVWWINDVQDGGEIQEMINPDIAQHENRGYSLVDITTAPVDRTAVVVLRFKRID